MSQKHPIFDPDSNYSRLRAGFSADEKWRGYDAWLRLQEGEQQQFLRFKGGLGDAFRSTPRQAHRHSAATIVVLDKDGKSLNSVNALFVSDRVELRGAPIMAGAECRAFFIEREVLAHARRLDSSLSRDDVQTIREMFEGDRMRSNLDISRILASVPEMDGVISDEGACKLTARIEGAGRKSLDCLVVVMVDTAQRHKENHSIHVNADQAETSGSPIRQNPMGSVRIWDLRTGITLRRLEGHTAFVRAAVFSPDGRYVLTTSDDNTTRLWDVKSGIELRNFRDREVITSVAFSPDGRRVLAGSWWNHSAGLWDAESGVDLRRFKGHSGGIKCVAYSPDAHRVLTGSQDTTARLWDAESGVGLRVFQGRGGWVLSVVFSPDGRQILAGVGAGWAQLWDAESGNEMRRFEGHGDSVSSVAFSRDGLSVLTGSDDNTARLWDAQTSKELRRFEGHSNSVTSVAFSPNGECVLTGSDDKTARVWDVESGAELRLFEGHGNSVTSVAFSPDGRHLLTGG